MMVSVSIFVVVAMVVSVAFVNLSLINKKAQVNRALIDNVNLAMDVMAFKIREGREYQVSNPLVSTTQNNAISFKDMTNNPVTFDLGGHSSNGNSCIQLNDMCLTSSEVDITTLQFKRYYDPTSATNNWPREKIGVRVRGTIKYRQTKSDFSLQANISQRNR